MKSIDIRGYRIISGVEGDHRFNDLPEELCREICDVEDQGKQFSPSSRFIFSLPNFEDRKGIRMGTARAVIQLVCMNKLNHFPGNKVTIKKLK